MEIIGAPLVSFPVGERPLQLALVTETWPPEINGVAMTLQRLVDGLQQRHWQVTLVRPRQKSDTPANDATGHLLVPGIPIPGYSGLRFGMPMFEKLRALWKRQRPDVVHIATEGPLGWAALKAARLLSIPVTSSFHTNFHRYCRHYRLGWLRGSITRHLREFHNQTALTMVPNPLLKQILLEEHYRNVVVLGRGVDTGLFSPARRSAVLRDAWGMGPDQLAVLYVGRIAAEKNLRCVVQAFDAISQIRPGARMVWVGDGPELKKLRKIYPQHIFCGPKVGNALADHYASAELFLFPSMTETFGNVVPEAMASGLAVVAYDYAAATMLVRDGENGLLVPFGDQQRFIQRAASLAASSGLITKLGQAASLSVAGHAWHQVCDHFDTYLRQAASHSAPQASRALAS